MLQLSSAHYRCTGCGDCCRGWHVPLDEGEAQAFLERAAGLVPVDRLRGAISQVRHGGREIEALVGPGRQCPVLAEDQRCLIHASCGEAQKPRACQIFPLTFVATPTEVRVGLSFACPAVLDAEGPPLAEQRGEIEALYHRAIEGTRYLLRVGDRVALADGLTLGWDEARQLLDELARTLADAGPLLTRLCRAGALAALTCAELEKRGAFADALTAARAGRDALADEALADPRPPDRLSRGMLRTLVRVTASDRPPAARLSGLWSSLVGGGAILLRDGRSVKWADAERVRAGLGQAGEALLSRWLENAIESLTFFGDAAFGLPLASGLDLLGLSAAVAGLLARAYAAAAGREAVAIEDARAALRQLDGGLAHRGQMPRGFDRALDATAAIDLLREQLG